MKEHWIVWVNRMAMGFLKNFLVGMGMFITVIVFVNVLSRYLFSTSLPWSEELARFLFIWMTFIGAVVANDRLEHMRLDFIVEQLPPKAGKIVEGISYLLVILLLGVLFVGSFEYTRSQWDWCSSALGVKHGIVYMVAPISFGIMELQFVSRLVRLAGSLRQGGV